MHLCARINLHVIIFTEIECAYVDFNILPFLEELSWRKIMVY